MSSFSSFKTTVDNNNINDEFGALSEHSHYLLQQREQQNSRLLKTSTTLAPCLNPHCNHMVSLTANANDASNHKSADLTAPSSNSTSSATTDDRTQKQGMLRRSSAMLGNEAFNTAPLNALNCKLSPTTPTSTLSPSFSKNSVALSVSLNLSPTTSGGSPPFAYHGQQEHSPESHPSEHPHQQHHHPHSNLLRSVRAGGGSSTSLSGNGSNGAPYNGYELSQQLLDKQTSALERKYGGREAREAAITIQRAFRSYRLQKRFTTLAIQAICHQQLKQQKEQQQQAKQQQQQQQQKLQQEHSKQQHQLRVREESVVVEVPPQVLPKMVEALKVVNESSSSSVNLSPIDREAMQHRFSRKLSANYALDDLVRMQALQHQQTIQSNASGLSSAHHPNQYLSIPRQASPPVTMVTSYEPVYNPPSLYHINNNSNNISMHQHTVLVQQHHPQHHHQQQHQVDGAGAARLELPLKKKTSFSSTSSGGSSSSLHASSTSSKPSDLHSTTSRFPTSIIKHESHEHRLATSGSIRSQHQQQQQTPQLLNKQRMQKNSQQQLQQQNSSLNLQTLTANGGLSVSQQQQQASIHKTSSQHMMTGSGNGNGNGSLAGTGNTVAFAPTVDFVGGGRSVGGVVEGAVSSSVDAYRKRQYRVGLNLFNKSPSERGIRFLIANGYIEQSDKSEAQATFVAHFLLTRKGLSRQMIGEYISEPAAFNRSVLKSFCAGVNLTGIIVDEALRSFQVHFRFPGRFYLSCYK